jgi:hypothetical protein
LISNQHEKGASMSELLPKPVMPVMTLLEGWSLACLDVD